MKSGVNAEHQACLPGVIIYWTVQNSFVVLTTEGVK